MLVEFRVTNFRSIRDEQVLSLVASSDKQQRETHAAPTKIKSAPFVLKSAVLYGANASGKSNVIKALQFLQQLTVQSAALLPNQAFDRLQPFKLDGVSMDSPTEFEITFIVDGVRHQYSVAMTRQRIVAEHLLVYKAFKPQRWFYRRFDAEADKDTYEFGPSFKGDKQVWERATRPNALFLSTAVQLNSEALHPVLDWFANRLVIVNEHSLLTPQVTVEMLKNDAQRREICELLKSADIGLDEISVVSQQATVRRIEFNLLTGAHREDVSEQQVDRIKFVHRAANANAEFDLMEESSGTRNLLFLAGPVLDMLHKGLTFVIDELDTSLHTLLVQALVGLFHGSETNPRGAQLIFTTHDTALLDAYGLFRRDQVWLVEKAADHSSKLRSLLDFSPRKKEALERGYLQGRYGAIPYLPDPHLGLVH
jgi:uncharacterized protein